LRVADLGFRNREAKVEKRESRVVATAEAATTEDLTTDEHRYTRRKPKRMAPRSWSRSFSGLVEDDPGAGE
jgi:hypothetical protein